MKIKSFAFALPLLLDSYFPAVAITGKDDPNPWQTQRSPSTIGHNEAIGFYSAGCLNKAEKFPIDGTGFHVMRLSRNRFWLHQNLKDFLLSFASQVKEQTKDDALIGDIALPRGGPFTRGHASHQIGLDVDIWFSQAKDLGILSNPSSSQRENSSAQSMLNPQGAKYPLRMNPIGVPDLNLKIWNSKKIALLKIAAENAEVERIFVHPYIKKALCQAYGGLSLPDSAWLRKVRPWWGHEEHFHVRIRCPGDSPDCRPQEATPPGDGCRDDLAWWFSTAAVEAWKKIQSADPTFHLPKLPDKCSDLLK